MENTAEKQYTPMELDPRYLELLDKEAIIQGYKNIENARYGNYHLVLFPAQRKYFEMLLKEKDERITYFEDFQESYYKAREAFYLAEIAKLNKAIIDNVDDFLREKEELSDKLSEANISIESFKVFIEDNLAKSKKEDWSNILFGAGWTAALMHVKVNHLKKE